MQYGQQSYGGQPNYGGGQQNYGGGQQQYGQQQFYGGQQQQNYGGAQVLWRVHGTAGVGGYSNVAAKYGALPYTLRNGEEWVLSRWNMLTPSPYGEWREIETRTFASL